MWRLFEGFQILFTVFDYILGKRGIVFKEGHYSRKYGICTIGALKLYICKKWLDLKNRVGRILTGFNGR